MISFRPYQIAAQKAVMEAWAHHEPGDCHPMLVMCTGSGKTETAFGPVVGAIRAGERVVWLAHREELITQPYTRLCRGWPDLGLKAGIVQADRNDVHAQVIFASVPTLAGERGRKRLEAVLAGGVDLVVVDEAHHAPSRTHTQVFEALTEGGARALALTATPDREDGADLTEDWEIVYSYGITDAIEDGWLVPPFSVVHRLPELDLSKVSGRRDYDDAELGAALLAAHVVEHTVEAVEGVHRAARLPRRDDHRELTAQGRGGIVFTATVEQARLTAEALRAAGWAAYHVSGETPKDERRRLLRGFEEGRVDVLCNAAVLTEGTDLPRASFLVLARPTRSWSLYCQMIGRGLRLHGLPKTHPGNNAKHPDYVEAGGKSECLVIDLAGATEEHSLVAAPVLIGGSRCAASPNGVHAFERTTGAAGACVHCEKKVVCVQGAISGGTGGHEWDGEGHCTHCGALQCEDSPTGKHDWMPDYEADRPRRVCMWCDASVADPLGSLVGQRKKAEEDLAKVAWLRLKGLTPTTVAVHLDRHGSLFVVEADRDLWQPFWIPRRGRRPRKLTPDPVTNDQVRFLLDDIVRRAQRVRDPRDPQEDFHGSWGLDVRAQLAERAVRLGLAQRRAV